ncbi:uncharacterized protein [Amphiura filiformis]|uniref:uncharacterized protein isoform X2 n=1 Tax=Amphiura filiformis TaxID=82378 RepID=UPI003B228190
MATQGRKAYIQHTTPSSSHLLENARQSAAQMAEYYHTQVVQNGHTSPNGEVYYRQRLNSHGNESRTHQQGNAITKQQHIGALPDGVIDQSGYRGSHRSHTVGNTDMNELPSGQYRATPVNLEYTEDQYPDRGEYERPTEAKPITHESRSSTATKVSLKTRDQASRYWNEDMPEDRRTRSGSTPHRRHNTSPDHHYFMPAVDLGKSGNRKPVALTTDNLKYFERGGDKNMRRSNSNSTLNEVIAYNERTRGTLDQHRNYGSTSSIDVHSVGGESFFQMLQDFSAETDQRSPAPPQFNKLLQGKVPLSKAASATPKPKAEEPSQREEPQKRDSTMSNQDSDDGFGSPRLQRKNRSKREKKNRSKSNPQESGFLRRLSKKQKSEPRSRSLTMDDDQLALRMEERTRKRAMQHFDVQSMGFDIEDVVKNKDSLERKRNTATGASAASRVNSNTPEGSLENLLDNNDDSGDGKSNDLLHSCPFFCNELGGELEPRVSAARMSILNSRAMTRDKHRAVLYGGCDAFVPRWKGPVIEHVDYGAAYYKEFFLGLDHQNFFGIDDNLGPIGVSIKREKVEEGDGMGDNKENKESKDNTLVRYQYRIVIRTSELVTLRGTVWEEAIPSTAKHNKSQGIPLRDLLEYVVPDLPLACLRLAPNAPKITDQLARLDEQGVSKKYKVGIMYCRTGQTTEEEMYNNEHGGAAFEEFLNSIGERVRLKGFDRYRAQLDNKSDSTGTHSLYATYHDYEIMFHVSTMLPFTANNRQQLLRKRHIGNDIVTIVFQEEGSEPFTPKNVRSQFQHVFIIVRAHDANTDNVHYSIAVSRSKEVPAFGPPLPPNAMFNRSPAFAEFLLAKLINAENAVHKSDKFTAMAQRTRGEYLKDLAINSVTTTTIDSGTKFGKFSLWDKKKEKACPCPAPDFNSKGALIWDVQVYQWSPISKEAKRKKVDDFSLSDPIDCILGISSEMLVLLREHTRQNIFTIPVKSIIGWTPQPHSLKVYFNEGNCVRLCIPEIDLDETPEIIQRLSVVTNGTRTQEITLRRNGLGQLGFHVHYQGVVVEVDPYGFAWQAGLRKGARLVEICEIAVCTQSHDEMIDLLRTSMTVKVVVVPPGEEGSPRRGSTPIEYVDAKEGMLPPYGGRNSFARSYSSGKGRHQTLPTRGGGSGYRVTAGGTLPSHGRMPRVSEETLPSPGSVKTRIQSLETRISHQEAEDHVRKTGQHRYRATLNYWKDLNNAEQFGPPGTTSSHSSSMSMDNTNQNRTSREIIDSSLQRLANERRSVRETRQNRPIHNTSQRLRGSMDELDRIGHSSVNRVTPVEPLGRHSREVSSDQSSRHSREDADSRHSRENSLDVQQSSAHSRENSLDEEIHDDRLRAAYPDASQTQWEGRHHPGLATYPESRARNPAFAGSTQGRGFRQVNGTKTPVRHTNSADTNSTSTSNSDDKWYDTSDDLNGYHDSGVSISRESASYSSQSIPSSSSHPNIQSEIPDPQQYAQPERYSPTEHLYPDRRHSSPHPPPEKAPRPVPVTEIRHVNQSSSNLSDLSLHSSRSGGSSHHDSLQRNARRSPARSPMPEGEMGARTASPHGHISGHRRGTGAASSSSSLSETGSPKMGRRKAPDGRASSNESLRSKRSASQPSNWVQEDLRKLIAPESIVSETRSGNEAAPKIHIAPTYNRYNYDHSDRYSYGYGYDDYEYDFEFDAMSKASSSSTPPTPRRSNLHRTVSDESISAGGGPYNPPHSRKDAHLMQSQDMLFNSAPPAGMSGRAGSERSINSRASKTAPKLATNPKPGRSRKAKTVRKKLRFLENDQERLNLNNNRGSNPEMFPLPDNTTSLDWKNLLETAKAFEGLDHKAMKSVSATTLNDIETAAGALLFTNTAATGTDRKMLSKSSDSLTQAALPGPPRLSRYPMLAAVSSASVKDRDTDSAYEEGSTQAQLGTAPRGGEMESELRRLQTQLVMERKQKEAMLNKLDQLHSDNMRLQEESQMTAEQLRHFTDWFFNAIDK